MSYLNSVSLTEKTVLLVDDNPVNIELLSQTIQNEKLNILKASSGESAIEIAKQYQPDLIMLDVCMPRIDGFETCQRLKDDETTSDIPVIFVTAKTDREDIERGFLAGGEEYILKPFKIEEVCSRIRAQLILGLEKRQSVSIPDKEPIKINGMKVMIIDDNPSNIDALKHALEPLSLDIAMAPDGKVALDIIPRINPDLILLNIMMPMVNGFEVCYTLKEDNATKDIPVIFVTSTNQQKDIQKGFLCGCVDYFLKPVHHIEVQARVKSHLKLRKLFIAKRYQSTATGVRQAGLEEKILG